jgi:hypothetical protein
MTRVPPGTCDGVGSPDNKFDPDLMRCLYDEGRRYAREDPQPWLEQPPIEGFGP